MESDGVSMYWAISYLICIITNIKKKKCYAQELNPRHYSNTCSSPLDHPAVVENGQRVHFIQSFVTRHFMWRSCTTSVVSSHSLLSPPTTAITADNNNKHPLHATQVSDPTHNPPSRCLNTKPDRTQLPRHRRWRAPATSTMSAQLPMPAHCHITRPSPRPCRRRALAPRWQPPGSQHPSPIATSPTSTSPSSPDDDDDDDDDVDPNAHCHVMTHHHRWWRWQTTTWMPTPTTTTVNDDKPHPTSIPSPPPTHSRATQPAVWPPPSA